MTVLDLRQSNLELKLPASGPASVRFLTELDVSGWRLWVQPRSLRVADIDEAVFEFVASPDGDGVTFSLDDAARLTQSGTLVLADGDTLLTAGFCSKSLDGAVSRTTEVQVLLGEGTVTVSALGAPGVADDDPRLSDARTPTGGAGGALSGTYPNPGLNQETVHDMVAAFIAAGENVAVDYDDEAGTLTISAAGGSAEVYAVHLPLAIEYAGGSWLDPDTAVIPSAEALAAIGDKIVLTEQALESSNDVFVHIGGAIFIREPTLTDENTGKLLAVATMPLLVPPVPQVLQVTGANALRDADGLTPTETQALIDASVGALDFATAADVAEAIDAASEVSDALAAMSAAADPAAWLHCTGDNLGAFVTSNLGDLPNGIDIRATVRMRGPSGPGIWFSELLTQTHDDGEGSWDNFEWAWAWADGSVWLGDAAEAVAGKPYDYWEWTKEGGLAEAGLAVNDIGLQRDVWISARRVHDVHAGTVTVYREVPWAADDTTADGRHWRIMSTVLTTPDATSIDSGVTEDWSIGLRADADVAELVIHHGPTEDPDDPGTFVEGEYLGGPTQADIASAGAGASVVTDSASNVWSSVSGTVGLSLERRVAALEALLA